MLEVSGELVYIELYSYKVYIEHAAEAKCQGAELTHEPNKVNNSKSEEGKSRNGSDVKLILFTISLENQMDHNNNKIMYVIMVMVKG